MIDRFTIALEPGSNLPYPVRDASVPEGFSSQRGTAAALIQL